MFDYEEMQQGDTFQKVSVITRYKDKYSFAKAFVDGTSGYSSGVLDVAKNKGIDIIGINFAQKAFNPDMYPNAQQKCILNSKSHQEWILGKRQGKGRNACSRRCYQ
jgi:hypothetical protein